MEHLEKLYKISQVAQMLNTSRSSVLRWIYQGKLKGIRIFGTWRVPESELKRLLQS